MMKGDVVSTIVHPTQASTSAVHHSHMRTGSLELTLM
jgi:hypothetical protein